MNSMRVLYFSRSYTIHDRRFLTSLSESGHEVFYLRLERDEFVLESRPLPAGITEVHWKSNPASPSSADRRLRLLPELESILLQVRPDLVHAGPVPTCGFMAALSGFRPLLLMSWGSDLLVQAESRPEWRRMTQYALKHSDMLAVDCTTVREKAQQLADYPADRIVQFPWGIDLDAFLPDAEQTILRKVPGWQDAFIILSTRSWEEHYGTMWLLEAFWSAYQADPRLRLALLGDGSLRAEVSVFVRERDLETVVHTPGQIGAEQLPEYFGSADLFVNPAYSDGTSISLLEAMASALPVVATDHASNREWVVSGQGGLLAPFDDTARLRDALLQIASLPPATRREWGAYNRKIAEERADWKKNFPLLLQAYARIESMYRAGEKA
ncbi:MAG TPA: glycosyltransferase [Candidatus Angelobacter sp.]|nr:glycosyltransferase [Candidatus Angelobacter sp.]